MDTVPFCPLARACGFQIELTHVCRGAPAIIYHHYTNFLVHHITIMTRTLRPPTYWRRLAASVKSSHLFDFKVHKIWFNTIRQAGIGSCSTFLFWRFCLFPVLRVQLGQVQCWEAVPMRNREGGQPWGPLPLTPLAQI